MPDGTTVEESKVNDMIIMPATSPGIEGAIQAYQGVLPFLSLSGPAHFKQIIQEVNKKHVDHDLFYKVLIIITDGDPNDLEQTIDSIVISSHKPISIIIISLDLQNGQSKGQSKRENKAHK